MNKFLSVFKSRKFWAAVFAIAAVFGLIPEGNESAYQEAVLTVVTSISYIFATALEDAKQFKG